jgi:hypothetical protein
LPFNIHDWKDIQDGFDGAVLLGNGASIAVDNSFDYGSLKQHATDNGLLTEDVRRIFNFFHTDDFELILRIVWQATNVNKSLTIEDEKTEQAYAHVRECLISAVRDILPKHENVAEQIPAIYEFMKRFDTVISLNYDLIVYWAMRYGSDINDQHAFKDCFVSSEFNDDWQRFRDPIGNQKKCTLVFYPHGNLILARDKIENERKISSNRLSLIEEILSKWEKGSYVPLFVSEGTTEQKVKSIKSSFYLNTVYREVLLNLPSNLVLYGWGLGEHDFHIIKRIAKSEITKIAVSVFGDDQGYCNRVNQILKEELGQKCETTFFDSQSDGCWNHNA